MSDWGSPAPTRWASGRYPALGFDPLPGDSEVVRSLQHDAGIFGERMLEQATVLRRFARREDWRGEAADAFAAHVETLPRDLERCGGAFRDLSQALGNYATELDIARRRVDDLERRAADARQKVTATGVALHAPSIQAPGDCAPLPPDSTPLDDATKALDAVLREAHDFAEHFDQSPEVQALARAIRSFTEFAPEEPHFSVLRRWAGDVFKLTPQGMALEFTHHLINHYAAFFSEVSAFLSDISGTIGIASIPLMFVPGVGPALAVASLSTVASSTAIKTSLYVGKARDAHGDLYVDNGKLLHSIADTALAVGGIGMAAKATQAAATAEEGGLKFSRAFATQFSKKTLSGAALPDEMIRNFGAREGIRRLAARSAAEWAMKGNAELAYTIGGAAVGIFAPMATDVSNVAGWKAPILDLPSHTLELVRGQAQEHIQLVPPAGSAMDHAIRRVMTAPQPRQPSSGG